MSVGAIVPWRGLERWNAAVFGLAVMLFVGAGALKVLDATMMLDIPAVLLNVFGQGGLVVSLLGVLGLHPGLADRAPRLSTGGAVCAAVGAVSFAVAIAGLVVVSALNAAAGTSLPMAVFGVLFIPGYLGAVLAYVLVGAACIRTDAPSRVVGGLLVAVVVVPLGQMLGFALLDVSLPTIAGLGVADIWIPAVLLVVWYLRRRETPRRGRADPSTTPR